MDANNVALLIGIIASLPGVLGLALQWWQGRRVAQREAEHAPIEDNAAGIEASKSAAEAMKSYSDEVIKLRGELAEVRIQLDAMRVEMRNKDLTLDEWRAGIERLIAQLVSHGLTPIWRPKTGDKVVVV